MSNARRYDRLHPQITYRIREGGQLIQSRTANLKAICFDLDWTLSYYPLTTQQVLEESLVRSRLPVTYLGDLARVADRYNELWLELERDAESLDSLRLQITSRLFEENGRPVTSATLKVSQAYDDIRRESGVLAYPGVDDLLADLKPKYKLGLYTNGPSFLQWEKIRSLGFDQVFHAIVVAGDVNVYKPDPQAFNLLTKRLDVAANETLFVGDNYEADVVGAHNAGMTTAWINHKSDEVIDGVSARRRATAGCVQPTFEMPEASHLREVLL